MKKLTTTVAACALMISFAGAALAESPKGPITLTQLGSYRDGAFDESASEIPAYDAEHQRLYVTNGHKKSVDILDVREPQKPVLVKSIDLTSYGAGANSVDVANGLVAVAVENKVKTEPGFVVFFDYNGNYLSQVTVGAQPDMIKFTKNGSVVLVACEGEPSDDFKVDPEGTIALVTVPKDAKRITEGHVQMLTFNHLNDQPLPKGMRHSTPNSSLAQDIEPEYIALNDDESKAYVSLQESNAIAVVDVVKGRLDHVFGLGYKDHSVHGMDASNKDKKINIQPWPVKGMYMPDSIAAVEIDDKTYILTANEGDSRDYDGWSEETRVAKLKLDPTAFPNAEELQKPENLGRLKTTTTQGDTDGDGDFDEIYSYGGRSFSIWSESGELIFDSGDAFEQYIAKHYPDNFNSNQDENGFDDRSDDKGPEPEAITVGWVNDKPYAFIGLERFGGIFIYDISNPKAPEMKDFILTRHFDKDIKTAEAGNISPEGFEFVPGKESPTGKPLLIVGYETSGTTAIFEITTQGNF